MSAWKSFKSGLSAFTATTRDTFGCTGNNGDAMDDEADNSYTADANGSDSGQPAFVEIDFLRRDVNRRRKFPDNSIRTAKYTLASGLPLSLLYQFYKISNFYFLLVMVLSLVPGASPINPFSSVVPLCIVLGAGIVKDLWEDWKRRKADQQANEMIVHVLRVVTDPDGSLPSAAAASSPYGSADDEATPSPCAAVSNTATTHHGGQGGNETTSSGTRACKPAAASASEAGDRKSNSATATAADGSVTAASFKEGQEVPVKERKRNRVVHFLFPSEKSKTRSSATAVSDMGSPDSNTHAAATSSQQHQQGDESAAASLLVRRPSKESDSAAKAPSASSTAASSGHGAPRVTFQPIRSCDVYPGDIMLFRLGEEVKADCIILNTSLPDGLTYIETANLDGETNAKTRRAKIQTVEALGTVEDIVERSLGVPASDAAAIAARMNGETSQRGGAGGLETTATTTTTVVAPPPAKATTNCCSSAKEADRALAAAAAAPAKSPSADVTAAAMVDDTPDTESPPRTLAADHGGGTGGRGKKSSSGSGGSKTAAKHSGTAEESKHLLSAPPSSASDAAAASPVSGPGRPQPVAAAHEGTQRDGEDAHAFPAAHLEREEREAADGSHAASQLDGHDQQQQQQQLLGTNTGGSSSTYPRTTMTAMPLMRSRGDLAHPSPSSLSAEASAARLAASVSANDLTLERVFHERHLTLDERLMEEGALPLSRHVRELSAQYDRAVHSRTNSAGGHHHHHHLHHALHHHQHSSAAAGRDGDGAVELAELAASVTPSVREATVKSAGGAGEGEGGVAAAAAAASAGSHGVVLVSCAPTPDLSVWYGQLRLPTGEMVPLGIDQFIPRGCLIRNTDWVLGAVVYTGSHTKMLLNLRPKPNKITNMTRRLNQLNVFLFALNQVLMFLMCGMAIWSKHYLLRPVPGTVSDYSTWYLQWTLNRYSDVTLFWWRYLTNFILLSYLIPMSLYVTLEFNKAMQMLMIGADKRMAVYDEFTGTIKNARPKTSELNCQLGYVRYIFTDKTGTLTENLMTYVGGVVDGHTHSETEQPGGIGRALLRRRGGGGNNSNTNYRDSNTFHNTASWNGGTAARRIASLGSGVFNDDFLHLTASGVGGFHNAMDSSFAGPVNDGVAGNENGGGHGQPRPPPPPPLSVLIPALARNRSTMPADGGEAPTTNNGNGDEEGSGNAGSLRYPAPLTAPPSAGAAGQTGLLYQMPTALATPTAPYPSSTPFPPPPLQGISRSSLTATTGAAANLHRRVTSAEGAAVRFTEPPAPASPAAAAGSSAGAVEALITPPRPGHARLSSAVGLPPASPKSYHHGVLSGGGGAFQLGNSGTFGNFGSVSAGAFLSASNCYDGGGGGGGGRHYSSSGLRYVSEAVLERDPLFRYLRALALCHSIVCFPVTGPDSVAADDNDNSANHKNNNSSSSNGHPQHTGGGSKDAGDGNRTAAAGDDAKAERRRLRKEKRERRRDEKKQKKKEKKAAMGKKKKEHRRPADATAGALATHEGEAPMQPASRNPSAHHSRPHRSTTEPADTSAAGVQRDGAPAHARHGSNVHVPPVSRTLSLSNIPPSNFVEIPYAVPAGPDRDAHEPYSQSPSQPAPLPHYHHRRGPSNGAVGSHEPVTSATVSGDYPPPYSGYQMTTSPSLTPPAQNAVTPSASVRMVPSAAHHPEPHSSVRPPPLSLHHHHNSPSGVSKLHGRTSSASWYQNRYFNRVMHSRNLSQNSNMNSVRFGGAAAAAGSPLLSATANSRVFRNGTSTVGSVAAADGLAGTLAGGGLESFIDRSKIYEGQSLDEIALVNAARENGFSLFERTAKQMYVKALGRVMCYDIIAELEFTPQRKLMSILLQRRPDLDTELAATSAAAGTSSHYHRKSAETRAAELQQQQQQDEMMSLCQSMNAASVASRGFTDHEVALSYLNEHHQPFTPDAFPLTSQQQQQLLPQDSDGSAAALRRVSALGSGGAGAAAQRHAESKKYLLLVKGADSSMMEIVNMQKKSNTRVKEKMLSELDAMAQLGLRTLVLGQRHVDEAEVLAWLPVYNEAQCSMQDRNERLHEAYAMLEKNVDIVGTTAVEDKLQDEVPQTLEFCIQASIVVWMLTGDKRETAVTIAHTSGLVSADYTEYVCHLDVSDLVEEEALLKQQRQYEERAREKQQEKKDKNKKDRKKRVDGDGEGENDGGNSSSSGDDDDDDHSEESDSVSVSPSPTAGQPSPPSGSKSIDVSSATQPQHGLSSGSHSPGPQSASTVPGEGGSLLRAAGHSSMPDKAATAESFMERKLARIEAQLAAAEQKCAEGEEAFGTHTVVVVVDGKTLDFIFQDNARAHRFFLLGSRCRSAVCCRMTPLQKAKIVRMFKRNMNAVALAIGDGANDVSMIQESSIGVGIMGLEGSQAELASDYAIPKFRFLKRLLFVHGRFSVFREAHCIVYSLYKNVIVTVGMMAYQFYTCYSGQALMDSWLLAMFSIFFCSLQPLMIGILDKDVEDELAESLPKLYPPLAREYMYFSYPYIMKWLLDGLLEGIFFFFVLMYTVGMQDNLYPHMTAAIEDYGTTFFTMLVLVADFRVGTLVTYYMILFALAVSIEILLVPIIELVYSAMHNLAGSNWCVRIANELYGTSGKFWLMLFFACGVLVMVTMASNMYIQLFAPWQNAGFAMRAAKASNHRVPYRHMKKELKAEYARLLARYEELRQQLEEEEEARAAREAAEEEERDREREGSGGGSFGGTARDHR